MNSAVTETSKFDFLSQRVIEKGHFISIDCALPGEHLDLTKGGEFAIVADYP